MAEDGAREVQPVVFFDKGKRPAGKDFAIRPQAVEPLPELEPIPAELEAELAAQEAADIAEEQSGDPKGSPATGSAESLNDLIPSAQEVLETEEAPATAEKALAPTSTGSSTQTSSQTLETSSGNSAPPVVPVPVTTPSSGSATPQKRVTKRSSSVSTVQ